MFACSYFYFKLQLSLIIIHITCISLSLRRTSAPIHMTNVLGVLGTQETSCILIAGLLERDIFDLFLSEFDKPWMIHLRETCCCSINLCTWWPNTVYKNRSTRRYNPMTDWCREEESGFEVAAMCGSRFSFFFFCKKFFRRKKTCVSRGRRRIRGKIPPGTLIRPL
jgi:hypothetical protein